MRRRILTTVAVATVIAAGPLGPLDQPAGAAVVVTGSGTTVTATVTGFAVVSITCVAGTVQVMGTTASPAVPCATLSQATVIGDAGIQQVDGRALDGTDFPARPRLIATLGGGDDDVRESMGADQLDLGDGADRLFLYFGGAANGPVSMGAGTDEVNLGAGPSATTDPLTATLASSGASATLSLTRAGSPAAATTIVGAERISLQGSGGADTFDASAVTTASALSVEMNGSTGVNLLVGSPKRDVFRGSGGTNRVLAGAGDDYIETWSSTDSIDAGSDDDPDGISEDYQVGGRTLTGFGVGDRWYVNVAGRGLALHVGPAAGGTNRVTSYLDPGIQSFPASLDAMTFGMPSEGALSTGAIDLVATRQSLTFTVGYPTPTHLFDVTIPTGTWTDDTAPNGVRTINPADPAYGTIVLQTQGTVSVHGPWADPAQSFAHRLTRDLLVRLSAAGEREAIRSQLVAGTLTRAQHVDDTMAGTEYRAVEVDRAFLRFLRRTADPAGRAYWVEAIGAGRSMRQFRAQLFGSDEYFARHDRSNPSFVQAAYYDVLGRYPDPAGQAYWVDKIETGTDRGTVAKQFLATAEASRSLISEQYGRLLDRAPTSAEVMSWTSTLGTATGEQDLIATLAASATYYNRS